MKHLFLPALLLALVLPPRCRAQGTEPHTYAFGFAVVKTKVRAVFDSSAVFVDGRLLDRATKKPIAGAAVSLAYGPGQQRRRSTRSSESGFFRLGWVGTAPGRQLRISAPGYETLQTDKLPLGEGVHQQLVVELAAVGGK